MGHRRLAVVDLSAAAAQPMCWNSGGRCGSGEGVIVYNGELYNDAELRRELTRLGVVFQTLSDTETVAAALGVWGVAAIGRLRGMFALAWVDLAKRRMVLARDPLGIKPLYYTRTSNAGASQIAFASAVNVAVRMAEMGGVSPRPDMGAVSAYLTTIRTTLGERTLFEGVRVVLAGQVLEFDLSKSELPMSRVTVLPCDDGAGAGAGGHRAEARSHSGDIRAVIEDSVRRHLRSDVPLCCLLSGGLDSSIICSIASKQRSGDGTPPEALRTYCAGAIVADDTGGDSADFAFAALMAEKLGATHHPAEVSAEMFIERWSDMVARLGTPLSTPNEVAINEVARMLRREGNVVALSGEGADELFGGYLAPMMSAARYVAAASNGSADVSPGVFHLREAAWIPVEAKSAILNGPVLRACEGDAGLIDEYERTFAQVHEPFAEGTNAPDNQLQAHLRFIRKINLVGLLHRLDSATMLEGVEGRTPFADVAVAAFAERLPMRDKFLMDDPGDGWGRTKRCLRRAFAGDLPAAILQRDKASFPLPFQAWMKPMVGVLEQSPLSREIFTDAAKVAVAARPDELWRLAWPMVNIALWGRAWWG